VKKLDTQISYGIVALSDLPRGTYNVNVKMGKHSGQATDFTVSLYSKVEPLKFEDKAFVYSELLARAERAHDTHVFKDVYENSTVKAYLQEEKHLLTVELEKTRKQDITLTIQVEVSNAAFPEGTLSNSDWKKGLKQSKVKLTEGAVVTEYQQMQVLCPSELLKCLYVIPHAKRYIGTVIDHVVVQENL